MSKKRAYLLIAQYKDIEMVFCRPKHLSVRKKIINIINIIL